MGASMEEKYFVASNSADGFCSYYKNAFDIEKFNRIYAIKGGSGTGKATFMKKVAREAEKRDFSVRYIYCSSDAQSLDAVIIKDLGIAVLDGTAPHVYEPRLIGAVDTIVDLGRFLNEGRLFSKREQINSLSKKKGGHFTAAYKYLAAYRELSENMEKLIIPAVNFDKMRKYISRFATASKGGGREENLLVSSIGMRGLSHFDTYFNVANIYYQIKDYFETGHIFITEVYRLLDGGADLQISNAPIIPSRLDALLVKGGELAFEIADGKREGARVINMQRFVHSNKIASVRTEYRAITKSRDEILALALDEFKKISEVHFELEKIYGEAMDFAAKEQFEADFCNKIFQNN